MKGSNGIILHWLYFTAIGFPWTFCQTQSTINDIIINVKKDKFVAEFRENPAIKDGESEEQFTVQSTTQTEETFATTFDMEPLNNETSETLLLKLSFNLNNSKPTVDDINQVETYKTTITEKSNKNEEEEITRNNFSTTSDFLTDEITSNYDQQYYINAEEQEQEEQPFKTDIFSIANGTEQTPTISPDMLLTEDFIEKKINEAINSITGKIEKLPELVLSDNKTHFKFHKDSKEILMDEKITQIAKQLAEKSLRKQYEKQKFGAEYTALKKFKNPVKMFYSLKSNEKIFKSKKSQLTNESTLINTTLKKFQTTDSAQEIYESVSNLPLIPKINKSEDH